MKVEEVQLENCKKTSSKILPGSSHVSEAGVLIPDMRVWPAGTLELTASVHAAPPRVNGIADNDASISVGIEWPEQRPEGSQCELGAPNMPVYITIGPPLFKRSSHPPKNP